MPLKAFQENYWNLSDTAAPAPTPVGRGGYPSWQSSIVASLFGALWDHLLVWWGRLLWWGRLVRRVRRLGPEAVDEAIREAEFPATPAPPTIVHVQVPVPVLVPAPVRTKAPRTRLGAVLALAKRVRRLDLAQQIVVERAVTLLEDPRFSMAQLAVEQTATTDGFQRPEAWRSLSHLLKADQGRAENMWRHVRASEVTRHLVRDQGSTLSNPQINLLVELAYHEYTVTGRR